MECYYDDDAYKISDEEAILTPARVRGYVLSSKKWAFLLIDEIREVAWNTHAFARLEMDLIKKNCLLSLVESHSAQRTLFDDIILDKGKGVVVLLHGAPGLVKP